MMKSDIQVHIKFAQHRQHRDAFAMRAYFCSASCSHDQAAWAEEHLAEYTCSFRPKRSFDDQIFSLLQLSDLWRRSGGGNASVSTSWICDGHSTASTGQRCGARGMAARADGALSYFCNQICHMASLPEPLYEVPNEAG